MQITGSNRLTSLDGLRGVAAIVVLVHHALLLVPALAAPYYGGGTAPGWPTLLVRTPLHLAWAGTEAVYLFFVLSGLVLAMSIRSSRFSWDGYYPSRILRLYLPVVGAVLLGLATILLVPRQGVDDPSAWLANRPEGYTPAGVAQDLLLVGGTSGTVSPLWSLQWEVLFSIALPLYVFVAMRVRPVILGLSCIALSTAGAVVGSNSLTFLPMFGIGVALATAWDRIARIALRSNGVVGNMLWALSVIVALLAIVVTWTGVPFIGSIGRATALPAVLTGIIVLIIASTAWAPLRQLLSSPIFRWLGLVSFSLYLVHEPILIAAEYALGNATGAVLLGVPIALAVAWVFHLTVERPAHRLARVVRERARREDSAPDAAEDSGGPDIGGSGPRSTPSRAG